MEKLKKMLKALDLVSPAGMYSVGLVINRTGQRIMWAKMPYEIEKIDFDEKKDEMEILRQIYQVLKSEKWLVLSLKVVMTAKMFTALKQLASSNYLQIVDRGDILKLNQSDKSRIIITGESEIIRQNEEVFQGFKNVFGPVITI